jgi:hypothetical protein
VAVGQRRVPQEHGQHGLTLSNRSLARRPANRSSVPSRARRSVDVARQLATLLQTSTSTSASADSVPQFPVGSAGRPSAGADRHVQSRPSTGAARHMRGRITALAQRSWARARPSATSVQRRQEHAQSRRWNTLNPSALHACTACRGPWADTTRRPPPGHAAAGRRGRNK